VSNLSAIYGTATREALTWHAQGACQRVEDGRPKHDPDLWWPTSSTEVGWILEGKRICLTQCPVLEQCRAYALDRANGEKWGTWGGTDEWERHIIWRRQDGRRVHNVPMHLVEHGTTRGVNWHESRGERPCMECLPVKRARQRERDQRKKQTA